MKVKYLNKGNLIHLALLGQKQKRGTPTVKVAMHEVENLDNDLKFPITNHMMHNDVEVRCTIAISPTKIIGADIPIAMFNELPTMEIKL